MSETYYPVINGVYKHYKGGLYKVLSMATHSETNEPMVVYQSLLFGSIYVRPLSIWNESVQISPINKRQRFIFVQ
jgi:hypothetical protein